MSDQGKTVNDHIEVVGTHDNDGDIAMRIFGKDAALPGDIDPAEERRLVRKIDWFIIPLIAITYLITYIDKATLSYAALFGMRQDVGLVGMDYSWLGSIFYFGYLFFEFPTSWCMQKLSVAKWLALNIAVWGCICALLGACNSFSSLAALRFILGALESCSTPAYLLITAMWYKVEEQPIRIGVWSICLGLANAVGGLLGYGIGHIHGSLANWRYQFIIIGVTSAVWGVFLFFALAESPLSARWLNEREKMIAVARLRSNQTGIKNTAFKISHVTEAFLDPKTWFLVVFGLSTQLVNGAVSNFGTLIISGFGYSTLVTSLLQIPYGFLISISILGAMFLQRWMKGQMRCIVGGLFVLPSLAGIIGVHLLPQSKKGGLLACYYLTATYTASFAICMSLIIANTAGTTKRSCVSAIFFVSYCVGNIIGPFAFKSNEAPRYESGIVAILTAYCVEIFVLVTFALYLAWCNKRKEQQLVELGLEFSEVEQNRMAFQDFTDRENPFFRYSY